MAKPRILVIDDDPLIVELVQTTLELEGYPVLSAGDGEVGLQTSTALAMAIGLDRVYARTGSIIHNAAAWIFGCGAFLGVLTAIGVTCNPVLTGQPVGGVFFNTLLLGYGMPAVLMAILARQIRETRPPIAYRAG